MKAEAQTSLKKAPRKARTGRFFLEQALQVNQAEVLDKRASHHISTVLRMRKGDTLVLFNGDGNDYTARILETGRRTKVIVADMKPRLTESATEITLVQCISRGERMDSTIRQAVELGVTRLCPVSSRHSVHFEDQARMSKKLSHWHNIVVSAVEQSGRSVLPRLDKPCLLNNWLDQDQEQSSEAIRLTLSPDAESGLGSIPETARKFVVLIGPESGLDTDEIELCTRYGFQTMRMGPRVLRTETAGPCILSILQARNGDMHS